MKRRGNYLMKRFSICFAIVLMLTARVAVADSSGGTLWSKGKVLDEDRVRYLPGQSEASNTSSISSNSSSNNGALNGQSNGSIGGDSTAPQAGGDVSGTTSATGMKRALPREYDNLTIDGEDAVYSVQERLPFRWSKGPNVKINGTVKYYVDGKKFHLMDDDGKEHELNILKTVEKTAVGTSSPNIGATVDVHENTEHEKQAPVASAVTAVPTAIGPGGEASVTIESAPTGADIEVDDAFVGDTPSTVSIASGSHKIAVMKKGYVDWGRTITITSGSIHLNADLDKAPAQK
jgi:hypothetical protein